MTLARVAAVVLSVALPLLSAAWLVRRVRRDRPLSWVVVGILAAAGAACGTGTFFLERTVLSFTELSIEVSRGTGASALLALVLFVAPLEEAAKVIVVWPTVVTRRLDSPGIGVVFAVAAACGFAAAETALFVGTGELAGLRVVRAVAGLFAHPFCAGVWGYALGRRGPHGARYFAPAWLAAVAIHAVYDHIVFGRGPGYLVISLPMLAAMAFVTWSALRDLAPTGGVHSLRLPIAIPEPPSLKVVRQALRRRDEPLLLRWIVFGSLVNVGAVFVSIAGAAFLAHRFGVDLSVADEADMRSTGPLLIVGAAILAAFPVAGFLVARASGAHTVLEPAFAAGLAIVGAVVVLSVTAPSAVIFAIAVGPVAFGLACGGAWFGMDS